MPPPGLTQMKRRKRRGPDAENNRFEAKHSGLSRQRPNVRPQPRPLAGVGCTPRFGERPLSSLAPSHVECRLHDGRVSQRLLHDTATLGGHSKFLQNFRTGAFLRA